MRPSFLPVRFCSSNALVNTSAEIKSFWTSSSPRRIFEGAAIASSIRVYTYHKYKLVWVNSIERIKAALALKSSGKT
jgi:hypothetical protein